MRLLQTANVPESRRWVQSSTERGILFEDVFALSPYRDMRATVSSVLAQLSSCRALRPTP
eukprot:1083201-Lingulodinium_polyedra.AAC.1